jgi:translation initiation factor IF-3
MFRGRERTHPELGQEILNRVAADTTQLAVVDSAPIIAGMDMNMVLRPRGRRRPAAANGPGSRGRLTLAGTNPTTPPPAGGRRRSFTGARGETNACRS